MTLTINHQDSVNLATLPDVAADIAAGKIIGSWWNKNLTYTGILEPAAGGAGINNGSNTLTVGTSASVSGSNTGDQTNITGNAATVTTINGQVVAGSNVTVTGSGTSGSPYSIASTGGGSSIPDYVSATYFGGQ